jgi:hypothetical protein
LRCAAHLDQLIKGTDDALRRQTGVDLDGVLPRFHGHFQVSSS